MRGYLGLGSNVGDRVANLRAACEALPRHGVRVTRRSSLYETAPQGEVLDQPDFLNACIEIETELGPEELLDACKAVERELGRVPGTPRHSARPIDVDVLMLGDEPYESERLRIPHADLQIRRFVLEPLRELAPELVDPDILASVQDQPVQHVNGSLTGTWLDAVAARDPVALASALTPDAKLRSPITKRIPFEGRERVVELMTEIFDLLDSVDVVRNVREDGLQILELESRLAGYDVHMVQVLELAADDRVRQITIFMRPLPGVANLAAHLAPRLVRQRRGPVIAALVALPMLLVSYALRIQERLAPLFA